MARQQGVVALPLLLAAVLLAGCLPSPAAAGVLLSTLTRALAVTASPSPGQVLHAGEDTIKVTWSLNTTEPAGNDAAYKNVKVNLCYAPVSQKDRGWRKSNDDLSKDKACQFKVTQQAYTAGAAGSFEYLLARDIPTGSYYVRAYALDASGTQVAYGQTGPAAAFDIAGITGIHTSIKVAAGVFSAFSVVSLAFFFVIESRKKNN
ncbi:high-affinity nitrate transporter-activating protein 2.1-like [Phragmites australis]|uniref:high-affinity nitrate transporter-activating protein 2.1-like n=1 Tax=Phragmites australis TaxID=29695 RepID=UPI002D7660F9|nr:high-affinity nitrate transporter-activating protein 2.1-like [Phragmites australis]